LTHQHIFYTIVKLYQFKTQCIRTQFLFCILYYWPEDGPLRAEHAAKLKIS